MTVQQEKLSYIVQIKLWNRKRLLQKKIQNVLKADPIHRIKHSRPASVKRMLFIEVQAGWGDFFYFLGLIKALHNAGISVDIASLPETYERYKKLAFVHNCYSIESSDEITQNCYDLVFDITYVDDKLWKIRQSLLKNLDCYTVTASKVTAHSKLFDDFLDLGQRKHWRDRIALIYDFIVRPVFPSEGINPFYDFPPATKVAKDYIQTLDPNTRYIYINTVARHKDRILSEKQITMLVDIFNQNKNFVGIFFTDQTIQESDYVKILPQMSFGDFSHILKQCDAIISPDTSVIHLGSILNIPVFGIYCGNYRDYFNQYAQPDVWAPLSKNSKIFFQNDPNTNDSSDFIYTHKKKPVSSYDVSILKNKILAFLQELNLPSK